MNLIEVSFNLRQELFSVVPALEPLSSELFSSRGNYRL